MQVERPLRDATDSNQHIVSKSKRMRNICTELIATWHRCPNELHYSEDNQII